jgi:DNA polymerase III epsilon subunit-like protein
MNKQTECKIVLDIETTGIPKRVSGFYSNPSDLSLYDSARIVELGYYIIDKNNVKLKEVEYLIKPENFVIPEEVVKIHGISQEIATKKGISIKHALAFLYLDLLNYDCKTFIAHNVEFDKNILLSECYRLDYQPIIEKLKGLKDYCTMKDNKIFNRWPKLGDLYEELFNEKIIIDHRSLSDVDVCHKCYCELMKMNDVNYIVLRNNKKIEKINLFR